MIADLSVGVLTLETDGELRYANRAALQMHGVADLSGLGGTSAGYQQRFLLGDLQDVPLLPAAYPLERLLGVVRPTQKAARPIGSVRAASGD